MLILELATQEERQPGFYWVLHQETWWVAAWALGAFWMPGASVPLYEHEAEAIGPQVRGPEL